MQFALHTTSPRAIERAAEAYLDAKQAANEAALSGFEALEELTFQQLLDLQDEASEDDSFDTFNDCARELRDRRLDAKVALVKLFVRQCTVDGEIPMVEGGQIKPWTAQAYMQEAIAAEGNAMAAQVLLGALNRDRLVAALAQSYANEFSEDLLRAGWTQ